LPLRAQFTALLEERLVRRTGIFTVSFCGEIEMSSEHRIEMVIKL
jgi:hypothetical protein